MRMYFVLREVSHCISDTMTHIILIVGCGVSEYPGVFNTDVGVSTIAAPDAWPWQVSVQQITTDGWIHVCGGVLIHRYWVITAAVCV